MLLALLLACTPPEGDTADAGPGDTYGILMSTLAFGRRADDGTAWGFDIDGHFVR